MEELFRRFLEQVPVNMQPVVLEINSFLSEKGCKCEIKEAKRGFVTSYTRSDSTKKLLNFVFRKNGVKIRIYGAHADQYESFLEGLPEEMKKEMHKAGDCKKLNDQKCSPTCPGGYRFMMDGELFMKCKNTAFMFDLNEENTPFIYKFLENEVSFDK